MGEMGNRMIFFLGLPGSGKSHLARREFGGCVGLIEYDLIRAALGHAFSWCTEPAVQATACTMARIAYLRGEHTVIIDECLTMPTWAAELVRVAREFGAAVEMRLSRPGVGLCRARRVPHGFPAEDFNRKVAEWERYGAAILAMADRVVDVTWEDAEEES